MAEGESIYDEIREQHAKLKDASFKEKLSYFVYYYKWHVIISIIIIAVISAFISDMLQKKKTIFYCAIINPTYISNDQTALVTGLSDKLTLNSKKEEVIFDTSFILNGTGAISKEDSYYAKIKLDSMILAQQIDAITCTSEYVDGYSAEGTFYTLAEILPEDLLKKLDEKGLVYYAADSQGNTIPAAIKVSWDNTFYNTGFYKPEEEIYIGFVANSLYQDNFAAFIAYLSEQL